MRVSVNYLTKNLVEFFKILRMAGMSFSVSDCITAVESLEYVEIFNKVQVKAALQACLVKDETGREIFSKVFDLYFVPLAVRNEYVANRAETIETLKMEIEESVKSLNFQDTQVELTDEYKEIFAGLPESEKINLESFLNTTSAGKNVRAEFKQLAEGTVKGKLTSLKQKYAQQLIQTRGILTQDTSEAGIIAAEVSDEILKANDLLHRNIGEINSEDVPAAVRLISELIENLKRELSRKYRKTGKKKRLDFKKTIQSNLSTGKVLFKLKYKNRLHSKSKLFLFCDVSASMLQFSSFVLQFISGIGKEFTTTESYLFSDDAIRMNNRLYYDLSDFETQVKSSPIWGKGTNIGVSLNGILDNNSVIINSSTVFLIVSDAKTLDYNLAVNSLKELSKRVKRVLWLNPVPEKNWTGIKGLEDFAKYCTMLDCSTLERLMEACRRL